MFAVRFNTHLTTSLNSVNILGLRTLQFLRSLSASLASTFSLSSTLRIQYSPFLHVKLWKTWSVLVAIVKNVEIKVTPVCKMLKINGSQQKLFQSECLYPIAIVWFFVWWFSNSSFDHVHKAWRCWIQSQYKKNFQMPRTAKRKHKLIKCESSLD